MRSRQQVIEDRRTIHGCCDRYADNMACGCLEKAEPDAGPCLTPYDVDEIEKEVARLYDLYNKCSKANCSWQSPHKEVRDLMEHLDTHFPGYYALQLISEVRFLQQRILELTRAVTK